MIVLKSIIFLAFLIPVFLTILHSAIAEIQHEAFDRFALIFDVVCLVVIVLATIWNLFDSQFMGFFLAFVVTKNLVKFILKLVKYWMI